MQKDYNTLENIIRLPHKYAAGPIFTRFYDGLRAGKILGSTCPNCKKVLVPARSFCPQCHANLDEFVEVAQEGEVVSWAYSDKEFFGSPGKPPFLTALIRLDGTDCDFLHLLGGDGLNTLENVQAKVKKGIRVKAVWNEDKIGRMLDIKYFEPVS